MVRAFPALLALLLIVACRGVPPDLPREALQAPVVPRTPASEIPGILRVRIVSEDGVPLPGALVMASSGTHGTHRAHSDDGGMAVFWSLPPGLWQVTASLPGFAKQPGRTVSLEPDGTTTTLLSLEREPLGHHTDTSGTSFPTTPVPTQAPKP